MKASRLLIVGLGELGGLLLQLLAVERSVGAIHVASRNRKRGDARCNLARMVAATHGVEKDIHFHSVDLAEGDEFASLVRAVSPDIVMMTATRISWWLPEFLPGPVAERLTALPFGVWLPAHLDLTVRLMRALKDASFQGISLIAPFPDVVNPVLDRLGLTPTCGIGNLAEILPKIQLHAAQALGTPLAAVQVYLVAHHALEGCVFSDKDWASKDEDLPPFFLRIEYQGRDVTEEVDAHQALFSTFPLPQGYETHHLTGAAAVQLLRAIGSPRGKLVHAPGPNGLPGGYPVLATRDGVRVYPPLGITLDEAIAINLASQHFDGIHEIRDDGTVVFCEETVEAARAALGYSCPLLPPGDIENRADELVQRLRILKEDE